MSGDWRAQAACARLDLPVEARVKLFFASPYTGEHEQARAVCAECPVIKDCTAEGQRRNEWGRWGRHSHNQRLPVLDDPVLPFRCDGCDRSFQTAIGLRSHGSQRRCGSGWSGVRSVRPAVEVRCDRCGVMVEHTHVRQLHRCDRCMWEDPTTRAAARKRLSRTRAELEEAVAAFEAFMADAELEANAL